MCKPYPDNPWIALLKAQICAWFVLLQTIHGLDKPLWIVQLQYTRLRHICGRPQLTRLCCDLLTHMHWHSQRRTHRNQVKTLTVSIVVNNNCYFDFILNWLYESVYSQPFSHKTEAKFCAQIEDVTFAATISYHDGATICTSLNELTSFTWCISQLSIWEERPDFAVIGDQIALCLQHLLTQTVCRMAYMYTSVSLNCLNSCSVHFVLCNLQIKQSNHGLSVQAWIHALSSAIHGLSTSMVCT